MNGEELAVVICTIICLVIISVFAICFNAYSCRTKAVMQEMEWSYGPIQGCMVKEKDGKWIDYQRLRYMEN